MMFRGGARFTYANVFDAICFLQKPQWLQQTIRSGTSLAAVKSADRVTVIHRIASDYPSQLQIFQMVYDEAPQLATWTDQYHLSVLKYTLHGGNPAMVSSLLRHPDNLFSLEPNKKSVFTAVVAMGQIDHIQILLNNPAVDLFEFHNTDSLRATPLGTALASGRDYIVYLMLAHPRMRLSACFAELLLDFIEEFDKPKDWIDLVKSVTQ
ncbi:hypothetical protein BO71DRAFT_400591, partial [Aspergillus ellipticus CBS 707.79]